MRAPLFLASLALLSCGPPGELGGTQPHGPPIATAGNWVPSEAAMSAVAGFPGAPFAGGGGGSTFGTTITSTVASGSQAIVLTAGARLCLNVACTSRVQDDGFGTLNLIAAVNTQTSQDLSTSGELGATAGSGTYGTATGVSIVKNSVVRSVVGKITVARTALTNASTTQDITLWTIPAKTRMVRLIADATAAFDDAAGPISAVTITCGKTAGGAEYLASGSIFTVNTLGDATGEVGASLNTYFGDIPSWSATTAVQCRFTSTGGNLSTLTTGSATFYLEWTAYP